MVLIDRTKLRKLMLIQGVTQRQVAQAAGWKSHSYLGRLMRGEVNTLEPTAALRIARFLGCPIDDLFVTRVSNDARRIVERRAPVAA